jgi:2-desacetyl-2-hydroxyethyl bacteriochlorophyllide A dehydrogenase
MKTVVFDLDRTVRISERPKPHLSSETGVLVKPSFIGICGTDLHAEVLDHFRPGVVMGHEFSGRVVATGRSARRFSVGDPVVVNPNGNRCGVCDACRSGRPNLCNSAVFEHGIGIHDDGGMAELVHVDERVLFAVPPNLPEKAAAWAEPLATAVRATRWTALSPQTTALVIGAGPIGLLTVQLLVNANIERIGVVEPSPHRRVISLELGAHTAVGPEENADAEPRRADVVFECSGSTRGFSAAMTAVRPGGTVVVLGLATEPLAIDPFQVVGREIRIQGSIIYDDDDFGGALQLLASGVVDVDLLTTDVMPLDAYAEAFRRLRGPEGATKILLFPAQ